MKTEAKQLIEFASGAQYPVLGVHGPDKSGSIVAVYDSNGRYFSAEFAGVSGTFPRLIPIPPPLTSECQHSFMGRPSMCSKCGVPACDYASLPHSGGGTKHGPAVQYKGGYHICQKCYDAIIAAEKIEDSATQPPAAVSRMYGDQLKSKPTVFAGPKGEPTMIVAGVDVDVSKQPPATVINGWEVTAYPPHGWFCHRKPAVEGQFGMHLWRDGSVQNFCLGGWYSSRAEAVAAAEAYREPQDYSHVTLSVDGRSVRVELRNEVANPTMPGCWFKTDEMEHAGYIGLVGTVFHPVSQEVWIALAKNKWKPDSSSIGIIEKFVREHSGAQPKSPPAVDDGWEIVESTEGGIVHGMSFIRQTLSGKTWYMTQDAVISLHRVMMSRKDAEAALAQWRHCHEKPKPPVPAVDVDPLKNAVVSMVGHMNNYEQRVLVRDFLYRMIELHAEQLSAKPEMNAHAHPEK